ncbi:MULTISPECIES: ATP-binding protein [Phenylobacterium]|uniref:histidine kinase n=1 Tax=Phenylobacterium koreense TaxID=266125 RepID=A0ABV2EKK6_9CAUL
MGFSAKNLIGRTTLIVAAVAIVQAIVSIGFYAAIDRQDQREDHARRIAELLVVGGRAQAAGGGLNAATDAVMTTRHLEAAVSPARPDWPTIQDATAEAIARQVIQWEPSLDGRSLRLWTERNPGGGDDLVGAMRLADGQWLTFRSRDVPRSWPIALRATVITLLVALLSLGLAIYALGALGRPLRRLAVAAHEFGEGRRAPVAIQGPADLRDLGRAFNNMQTRIGGLIEDQARAMEAISHDLGTPLSRLKIAADFIDCTDTRTIVVDNVDELNAMLESLRGYLRAQHQAAASEKVDLGRLLADLLVRWNGKAAYRGPDSLVVSTYRGPLEKAIVQLVDNAVRYGEEADVEVVEEPAGVAIHIRDKGPGIPQDALERIYEPFFRVDTARSRDTGGLGLGIPTAQRLLRRFGGDLVIGNGPDGGLHVIIRAPVAAEPAGAW